MRTTGSQPPTPSAAVRRAVRRARERAASAAVSMRAPTRWRTTGSAPQAVGDRAHLLGDRLVGEDDRALPGRQGAQGQEEERQAEHEGR